MWGGEEKWKCFLTLLFLNAVYEVLKWAYDMNEECYRLLIFRYLILIGFGCLMGIYKDFILTWLRAVGLFLIGLIYIILVQFCGVQPTFTAHWSGTSFMACLYLVPIMYFVLKTDIIRCKMIETIGKNSYYIFLVQLVYYHYKVLVYSRVNNRFCQFFIGLLACILIGMIFGRIAVLICERVIYYAEKRIFNS